MFPRLSSARPRASRTSTALWLCAVLALTSLGACQDQGGPQASSAASSQQTSTPAGDGESESPSSESTSQETAGSGAAGWSFPTSVPGWELTTWDEEGRNQLSSSSGCLFTSSQDYYDDVSTGDRHETTTQAERFTHGYEGTSATDVSFSDAVDDPDTVKDQEGNPVETIRLDWTYTADGKAYQGRQWLRVFTTNETPTLMRVMYVCPVEAFSQTEVDMLLSDTTLRDPGPADMDSPEANPEGVKEDKDT